jgi:hypothetical protein
LDIPPGAMQTAALVHFLPASSRWLTSGAQGGGANVEGDDAKSLERTGSGGLTATRSGGLSRGMGRSHAERAG